MISYWGQFRIGDGSFREKCPIGTGSFWDISQKEPVPRKISHWSIFVN